MASRVLGVDPSLASTGLALLINGKVILASLITTSPKCSTAERLSEIHSSFAATLAVWVPDIAAFEDQFAGRNMKTLKLLSQVKGVLLMTCAEMKIPIVNYAPTSVKMVITGRGNASKEDVAAAVIGDCSDHVQCYLSTLKKTDDVTDAIAIAKTYLATPKEDAI